MSDWSALSKEQLANLTTHRLYNIYKLMQTATAYDHYYESDYGDDANVELREKAAFVKSVLDSREHLPRKKQSNRMDNNSKRGQAWWAEYRNPARRFGWHTERPNEPMGPIKNPDECGGKQVFKRSGKPFKSKNKYNTVTEVTVNPHTNLVAFAFNEDTSIVDVHMCNLREIK